VKEATRFAQSQQPQPPQFVASYQPPQPPPAHLESSPASSLGATRTASLLYENPNLLSQELKLLATEMTASDMQNIIQAVGGLSSLGSIGASTLSSGSGIGNSGIGVGNSGIGNSLPPAPFNLSPQSSPTRKEVERFNDQETLEVFGLLDRNRTFGTEDDDENNDRL